MLATTVPFARVRRGGIAVFSTQLATRRRANGNIWCVATRVATRSNSRAFAGGRRWRRKPVTCPNPTPANNRVLLGVPLHGRGRGFESLIGHHKIAGQRLYFDLYRNNAKGRM